MPVSWFLLSLALGRSPGILALERLLGSQDTVRCSPGLSCQLWDGDVLCVQERLVPAPGPVLVPTQLQTELVLRCHQKHDCDLCVRVTLHLAVLGPSEEPEGEAELARAAPAPEVPANGSVQAHVVLSFQDYLVSRCALLEVQVPAARAQPGQSVGSLVFECFEATLGAEVHVFAYTLPRYQQELSLTRQLPDCRGLGVRDSVQSCRALPWVSVSADGDEVQLQLDVSEDQRFGLSVYLNQSRGAPRRWWARNLTGPQTIPLSPQDLLPCLCVQVWPLEPDSIRTSTCPFGTDPRAHRNLWQSVRVQLLPPTGWRLDAPCPVSAVAELCWQAPGGGPCQPLVPPLSPENVTANRALEFPLLEGHPNLCVQVSGWEGPPLLECLWADSLGPPKTDTLLVETRGAPGNGSFCALDARGCTPLLGRASPRTAHIGQQILQDLRAGQCLQLFRDDLVVLWACAMDKYVHRRWALVWLACLLLAAVFVVLGLLKKDPVKGWLRLLKLDVGVGGGTRARAALLLYSADDAGFERLVGALASALGQLRLRVAVDLWSRRELGALGPLAWAHARRRQTLQEGGLVVLLFSPGAVALCREWLQAGPPAAVAAPQAAFAAALSCVLPDFLQGRAAGRYVGACFDGLLAPAAVPAPFRAAPLFALPAQMPAFLGALLGAARPARLRASAELVARALRPALDSCVRARGGAGGGE
ncbi:interleukin-17 receptor C isoform X1 [Sorex araneus]|uniref:interleukin-17 receptor C isoform X1 n=1 Tax=Sorex araneus TaxID=42254 RepID=UPI002433901B|nr:interleukin-17 receptor C isoform X1 [Sorex araneus]